MAVREFFDRYAEYYERSWDLKAHGLHVGIFEHPNEARDTNGLEQAYQRTRDHVASLLEKVSPISSRSRVLDVCCGTGATLAQIVERRGCFGAGVDISPAQIERAVRLRIRESRSSPGELWFREGSASTIGEVIGDLAPFTHVFSQDGFLFVQDRTSAFADIHAALEPGGALVVSDFVPRISPEEIDAAVRARVYDDVKWKGGVRFQEYLDLLSGAGFDLVQVELRPLDMRTTYAALAPRTRALAQRVDEAYAFLADRYEGIVTAIDNQALTWGWFVARRR
jgi:SAM-dependent methyltransferase